MTLNYNGLSHIWDVFTCMYFLILNKKTCDIIKITWFMNNLNNIN